MHLYLRASEGQGWSCSHTGHSSLYERLELSGTKTAVSMHNLSSKSNYTLRFYYHDLNPNLAVANQVILQRN